MSNVPMTRPDEMLAEHTSAHRHTALLQLRDGRILQASGRKFTVSEDGGLSWSGPFQRTDKNGELVGGGGTSLVNLEGDAIGLTAIGGRADETADETLAEKKARRVAGRRTAHMRYWRSEDSGETWEPSVQVTYPGFGFALHNSMIRTSSGRLVLPAYMVPGKQTGPNDETPPNPGNLLNGQFVVVSGHWFDPRGPSFVYVMYSDDEGRTWERNHDGEITMLLDWNMTFAYVNEPSVAEVAPGRLLMMMRTQMGRLYQAWSYDDGETWTRPMPTSLAAGTTPAQIGRLENGHILAIWNQEGPEELKRGLSRQRISSAVSRNGGSIWEFFQNIESIFEETRVEPGPIERYQPEEHYFAPGVPSPERPPEYVVPSIRKGIWSYPSVLALPDRVLVAYSFVTYHEHETRAQLYRSNQQEPDKQSKIKVLPLSWFYGGKEPADNPELPRTDEPATVDDATA